MTAFVLPQPDRAVSSTWLRHGTALAALLLLTLVAFHSSVSAAVRVWEVSPTYSHCFLIIPIVLWLIWEKRATLTLLTPGLAPQALFFIPFLTLGWWMGELAAINEVQQFSVVGIMQALIVAMLGINIVRVIWFPVFYLLFLVPTGEYLILPMQNFAAHFVDIALNLLGIIHYREGTIFELTNGRFEIAEACAGLRFLIATVTLGVLFSYMMFRKIYKAVLFLGACVAVPLIGNGLRCVGIIVLAHLTNNQYGAGADHIVYGWGFNVAILLVLGVVGSRFRDDIREKKHAGTATATASPVRMAVVAALAAILLSAGPAVAWWHNNYFVKPDLAVIAQPFHPAGWREGPASPSWRPEFFGLDAQMAASLSPADGSDASPVDFYLGYYARPRPGHSMTAHANRPWNEKWAASDVGSASAMLAGKPVQFQETLIANRQEKRIIWSTYWVDGQFTASLFKVKLLQARAALIGHEGQAVIALSTPVPGTLEEARGRLSRSLQALGQLPARLSETNHQTPAQAAPGAGGRP